MRCCISEEKKILTISQDREQARTRLKRERSSSETVFGDDDEHPQQELEIVRARKVDRNAAKRARTRRLIADGSEVIEIED